MFDIIGKFKIDDPPCNFRLNKNEVILSSLAINFLSLALPIMTLQVYDRVMINHSIGTLAVLAIGVLFALFLEFILRLARSYTTGWAGMMYEYTMAANAMRYYINADPTKLQKEGAGKQIQNLGSFQKLRDFYGGQTLVTLVDVPFALIFIAIISYLTGILVLVPVVLIACFTLITWYMGNQLKTALEKQGGSDDERYNFIIESLQGIHSIKSYGIEQLFMRRYERLSEICSNVNYESSLISSQGYTFGILFNEIMIVMVISFGAPMVINGDFTNGALIATVLLSGRLMQPIQKTLFLWNQFQEYRIAYKSAENMFDIQQIERGVLEDDSNEEGHIEIKDVSFAYGERMLFKNVNLSLKIPDVIAIHGQTNSGKSTLMKLLAGIVLPTQGSVSIDGVNASSFTSEELVHHVGYISSDNVIFQGTIMENITAFNDANEAKAMQMAKLLNISNEVSLMPKGYDTKINDGIADTVAPGLKQRIAIARVLLHRPKVILFNNADKGLDREGYNQLVRLMTNLKGKVTMIIATEDHNINILADRHFVLQDGFLTETEYEAISKLNLMPYKELRI